MANLRQWLLLFFAKLGYGFIYLKKFSLGFFHLLYFPLPVSKIPIWNLREFHSSFVNWNIKSNGNLLMFRFTALFKLPVVT